MVAPSRVPSLALEQRGLTSGVSSNSSSACCAAAAPAGSSICASRGGSLGSTAAGPALGAPESDRLIPESRTSSCTPRRNTNGVANKSEENRTSSCTPRRNTNGVTVTGRAMAPGGAAKEEDCISCAEWGEDQERSMLQGLGVETGAAILQLMRQHNQQIIRLQRQQARQERELRDTAVALESLRAGQEQLFRKLDECLAPQALGPRAILPPVPPTPPGEPADWATVEALAALTRRVEELEQEVPEAPPLSERSMGHRSSSPGMMQNNRKSLGKGGSDKETAMAVKALQHLHMLLRTRVDQQEQQLRSLAIAPNEEMTHLRAEIADIAEIVHQLHKRLATDITAPVNVAGLPHQSPGGSIGGFSAGDGSNSGFACGRRSGSSSPTSCNAAGLAGRGRIGSAGKITPGHSGSGSRGASINASAALGPREEILTHSGGDPRAAQWDVSIAAAAAAAAHVAGAAVSGAAALPGSCLIYSPQSQDTSATVSQLPETLNGAKGGVGLRSTSDHVGTRSG